MISSNPQNASEKQLVMNHTELLCLWKKNKYLKIYLVRPFDHRVDKPFSFLV